MFEINVPVDIHPRKLHSAIKICTMESQIILLTTEPPIPMVSLHFHFLGRASDWRDAEYTRISGRRDHAQQSPRKMCQTKGRLRVGPDWSRLAKMIPGGLMSAGKSKAINGAASRKFKNMAGNFSGLSAVQDLFSSHDPKKHVSAENLKAVRSCEMWFKE